MTNYEKMVAAETIKFWCKFLFYLSIFGVAIKYIFFN